MKRYDYMEIPVPPERLTEYLEGYGSFGWERDERLDSNAASGPIPLRLRRDRNILNRTELTRLQRNYEACLRELDALEASEHSASVIAGLVTGFAGLALIAGAVFAASAERPIYALTVLIGLPGLALCALAPRAASAAGKRRAAAAAPLIERKREEILALRARGRGLMEL